MTETINKKFNLIDEKWIKVMGSNYRTIEVSIRDIFENAHMYAGLANDTPVIDFSILRLLLAILVTSVERYDESGSNWNFPVDDPVSAWKEIWDKGNFSMDRIGRYLDEWHDRFYLFHPQYPFYQVPQMPFDENDDKVHWSINSFDATLLESRRKKRLFSMKSENAKGMLKYPDVARSLVANQSFSDCPMKKQGEKTEDSSKNHPGWCGRMMPIYASGKNLFETLMLNLVLSRPNADQAETSINNFPVWERDIPDNRESLAIPFPKDLAGLFTLQSRRVKLLDDGDCVKQYMTTFGEIPNQQDGVNYEPMTLFRSGKDINSIGIAGCGGKESIQAWRLFPFSIKYLDPRDTGKKTKFIIEKRPLVADWISTLVNYREEIVLPPVFFRTVSIFYGASNGCVNDICEDEFGIHPEIFSDAEESTLMEIADEVGKIRQIAAKVGTLFDNLLYAEGTYPVNRGDERYKKRYDAAVGGYYDLVNDSLLEFILSFSGDDKDLAEWKKKARRDALEYGRELAVSFGRNAYVGRIKKDKKGNEEVMTAPLALLNYEKGVKYVYKSE